MLRNGSVLTLLLVLFVSTQVICYSQKSTEPLSRGDLWRREKPQSGKSSSKTKKNTDVSVLGLGYTLYRLGLNGNAQSVNPKTVFRSDQYIRFIFESKIDGYLYVFHTDKGNNPIMLFPNFRLQSGANAVRAFVPYEVPSNNDPDPKLRWLRIYGKPSIERFYVVVSRQPLKNVPINAELVRYCNENQENCPWKPPQEVWEKIKLAAQSKKTVNESLDSGKILTPVEKEAVEKSVNLMADSPLPAVINLSSSIADELIAITIDLNHK